MLAGLIVKGYKVYKNVKFIPFFETKNENLKLFIGPNGAGKSSILEALDTFFNNAKWTIHVDRNDSYVVPLFLLDKNRVSKFSDTSLEYIKNISAFLWNESIENNKKNYNVIPEFFEFRDKIKALYEKDHYLVLFGMSLSATSPKKEKDFSFATFDLSIKKEVLNLRFADEESKKLRLAEQNALGKLLNDFQDNITYIYIPTETNITDFLKLQSNEMQKLIDKRILDNIDAILTKDVLSANVGENVEQKNILELINSNLLPYVEEIEATIRKIDPAYKFHEDGSAQLNAKDINRQIIRAFYAKRILKKDSKSIGDLSSGERKKALLDIAYSFLSRKDGQQEKEIILAIDEPEASLDMSARYEQFETIEKLARICHILVATHWYGSLPILQDGLINHLEKDEDGIPKIRLYNVQNYFEDREDDPNDIYFKSFSELALAILTSLKSKEFNWIIVEGIEDKNYLEYYLKDVIENLRILPVGGSSSVKVLYQYLFISMIRKSNSDLFKGKVYCLVDTDAQILDIEECETANRKLMIRRLQCQKNKGEREIQLLRINVPFINPTEIEETLEPSQFYTSLKNVIDRSNDDEVKKAFISFAFNPKAKLSFVKGDDSILDPVPSQGRSVAEDKQKIVDFIDNNKFIISLEYCNFEMKENPIWVEKIIEYFNQSLLKSEAISIKTMQSEEDVLNKIEEAINSDEKNDFPEEVQEILNESKIEIPVAEKETSPISESTPPSELGDSQAN